MNLFEIFISVNICKLNIYKSKKKNKIKHPYISGFFYFHSGGINEQLLCVSSGNHFLGSKL